MKYIQNKRVKLFLLAMVFAMTTLLSFVSYPKPVYAAKTGTVNGTEVNVRSGPGTNYQSITKLNTGNQVTILDPEPVSGGNYTWYRISFLHNGAETIGYIATNYVSVNTDYSPDADFEAYLNAQGFPESYKNGLRQLHANYPKWVFVADHVGRDWETVLNGESLTGRSLVSIWFNGQPIPTSWKSLEREAYNWETGIWRDDFDSPGWVAASKELVAYALDPRNFLESPYIFMFETLSYNPSIHTLAGISSVIGSSFMKDTGTIGDGTGLQYGEENYTYPEALQKAAEESQVSPYHLAARIIQEIGSQGASDSISGTVGGYQGIYNYYNHGAYASGGRSAIINGLRFASEGNESDLRPWNTRMKSIIGGAKRIGSGYINQGQNTLYYQKFDIKDDTPFTHQYMTNILAPRSESSRSSNAYDENMRKEMALQFTIPVYPGMPESRHEMPTGNGDPNNILKSLSVGGMSLTPTFDYFTTSYDLIVDNDTAGIEVFAEAMSPMAEVVSGKGIHKLVDGNNTINIVVRAGNGSERTYTLNVVRYQNNILRSLSVEGLSFTPEFTYFTDSYDMIVDNEVAEINILAESMYPGASVIGAGKQSLTVGDNTFNIVVRPEIGIEKTYTLHVVRRPPPKPQEGIETMEYRLSDDKLSKVTPGSTAAEMLKKITFAEGYSGNIVNADGTPQSGPIGTGDRLIIVKNSGGAVVQDYPIIIYGDIDGDGVIDSYDLLELKRYVLRIKQFDGVYLTAANISFVTDALPIVDSYDLLELKRHVLRIKNITQ